MQSDPAVGLHKMAEMEKAEAEDEDDSMDALRKSLPPQSETATDARPPAGQPAQVDGDGADMGAGLMYKIWNATPRLPV